jgi:serine phosphatase RsbU (regulator of sigma subunit)/uncharacterized glyoxalase superfamily protein PhnB
MTEPSSPKTPGVWLNDSIVGFKATTDWGMRGGDSYRLDGREPYLRLHFVSIYVNDQERSLGFFRDQLGFRVVTDAHFASGNRWIEVSPPDGSAVLALVRPVPGLNEDHLVGNSGLVTFLTEDVDQKYREWSERGVLFTMPPQKPAWGGTFCRFQDPDGNAFALAGFTEVTRAIDNQRRAYAEKLETERRTAQELEIAREVQARLFPQGLPAVPGLDYAGLCVQARSVGGDYYDFLGLGGGRLALVLGDIAGKGIAASLLMANLQAALRSQIVGALDRPAQVLESVNRLLYHNSMASAYATLLFFDYEPERGLLRYANCGHVPALILRANGDIERLEPTCTVIGLFTDWECGLAETVLEEGDLLALCTDGVTEAFNDAAEEFGEERLIAALARSRDLPALEIVRAVVDEAIAWSGTHQSDDVTLIVARRSHP